MTVNGKLDDVFHVEIKTNLEAKSNKIMNRIFWIQDECKTSITIYKKITIKKYNKIEKIIICNSNRSGNAPGK